MNKTEFCQMFIDRCMKNNRLKNMSELTKEIILRNPSTGICLQHLGLIDDPELLVFLSTKKGIVDCFVNDDEDNEKTYLLSVREVLFLLPD